VTPERLAELLGDREDLADKWPREHGVIRAADALSWPMVEQPAE
jgi:hypothetical protein